MEISVNDLVERVKINMEELTDVSNASVKLEVGIDVEQYIRAKLPDALLSVWASTPVELLPQTDCASSLQPERQPDGSGRVVLPSDVWRMTEFCMEGWRQPVTSFIDHTSPAYELQFNLYTRGGVATPVCVLSNVGGQKCLDYYSLPASRRGASGEDGPLRGLSAGRCRQVRDCRLAGTGGLLHLCGSRLRDSGAARAGGRHVAQHRQVGQGRPTSCRRNAAGSLDSRPRGNHSGGRLAVLSGLLFLQQFVRDVPYLGSRLGV